MKDNYDFSNAKPNPYAKYFRKDVVISIDNDTMKYFEEESNISGVPCETLVGLYLADCANNKRHLKTSWENTSE